MSSSKTTRPHYREKVYKLVRRIPSGRVMTYGQIAELLGEGYTARTVGFVMHGSDDGTPWHRVLNARGACSTGKIVLPHDKQQRMLEAEGVVFQNGSCNLQKFLFVPPSANSTRKSVAVTLFHRKSSSRERRK